ncbi:UNVERIFIED_CONTAM: hypothetical protein NCL1_37881 [Trichonephila clavipes]
MQDPPDGYVRNPDMTGDCQLLVPGLFCTRSSTVSSLFGVLILPSHSYVSTTKDPLWNPLWCKHTKPWLGMCSLRKMTKLGIS